MNRRRTYGGWEDMELIDEFLIGTPNLNEPESTYRQVEFNPDSDRFLFISSGYYINDGSYYNFKVTGSYSISSNELVLLSRKQIYSIDDSYGSKCTNIRFEYNTSTSNIITVSSPTVGYMNMVSVFRY